MKLKDFYAKANRDLEEKFIEIDKRRDAERQKIFDSFASLIAKEIEKSSFSDVMEAANTIPDTRDKGIILATFARENPGTIEAQIAMRLAQYYLFVSIKERKEGMK